MISILDYELRKCTLCNSADIEDEYHVTLVCEQFVNLFSTNILYMEHDFHELILAQWGLIFGIINALLH